MLANYTFSKLTNFFKRYHSTMLIGEPTKFSLEERIFNTFCIIAFVAMCVEVPFNFVIGLKVPAAICIFGVLFSAFLYYLSRIRRKSRLGIYLFSVVCNLAFTVNYFYNSGIFGPNLLLFALAFLLIIVIIPKSQYKIWIPLNVVFVFAILVIEFLYPAAVPNAYTSDLAKAIDFGVTYLVMAILTYVAISYIRKNYDFERNRVVQKNKEIEAQNARISEQKVELEKLNLEKSKLFSIVAHDIRSPLSSVQSYLEILTDDDLNEEEKVMIKQRLLEVTRDTSEMLMNVLSWSKSQMKGAHVDLVRLAVGHELDHGLNLEKNLAIKKGIDFEIGDHHNLQVVADKNMFQIVIRNLVNNAIKFTPEGGAVSINITEVGEACLIAVKDNGLGVDLAQQENLFKLKASSTFGTNNEKGIGLGLLLCKEFTELQGGKIWFSANEDRGSTFYLSFKLAKSALF